jgi:cell division protein FtsZ
VIVGTVIDENMGETLRVTMVATGLGGLVAKQQSKPQLVVRNGTDNAPVDLVNYADLEAPTVMRARRGERSAQLEAMKQSGVDFLDIPAFLRKQAD